MTPSSCTAEPVAATGGTPEGACYPRTDDPFLSAEITNQYITRSPPNR